MKKFVLSAAVALGVIAPIAPAQAQVNQYLGQMMDVGFNFCPRGWANADGQIIAINSNQALFSLLGTTFGGDGRTTFALPDLRGRTPVSIGNGPGVNPVTWGEKGGANNVTLTTATMPNHTHVATSTLHANQAAATGSQPTGQALASAMSYTGGRNAASVDVEMFTGSVTTTVAAAGGGQGFGINDPFLGMRWCIATQGIFPSRN